MSPKSRFRFKRVLFVCSFLIVLIFEGCADKIKTDLNTFKALDESLSNSNGVINNSTDYYENELENKLYTPATVEKAKIWFPRVKQIKSISKNLMTYIESLKSDLTQEAGGTSFRYGDKNAVMRLFERKGKGAELYERLSKFESDVMAVDSVITEKLSKKITASYSPSENPGQQFNKMFFDDIPAVAALALLTSFQNHAKIIENKAIEFCNNQVGSTNGGPLSSSLYFAFISEGYYVKGGTEIEISAGILGCNFKAVPIINIAGKDILPGGNGIARFKFKVPHQRGNYKIPVKINYDDPATGKKTIDRSVEYFVIDNK